ncbi:hypothetical protein [Maridesulfovibrio bastinii]|uniref:hypothetical protein n=1 Tax=Maridesulfovibrio bastinii TaxID=47157 RepID=UPI000485CD6E|nr:hypothetical protein [Maridesulfovibrio bastinii]
MKKIIFLACLLLIISLFGCSTLALKSKSQDMHNMTNDQLVEFYYELNDAIADLDRDLDSVHSTPHRVTFSQAEATGQAVGDGAVSGYYKGQINNLTRVRRNVLMEMRKRNIQP